MKTEPDNKIKPADLPHIQLAAVNRLERLGAEHNLEWDALLTKVQETYEATVELRTSCDEEQPQDGMIERVKHGSGMPTQTTLPKKAKAALKEWVQKNKKIISWKKH